MAFSHSGQQHKGNGRTSEEEAGVGGVSLSRQVEADPMAGRLTCVDYILREGGGCGKEGGRRREGREGKEGRKKGREKERERLEMDSA